MKRILDWVKFLFERAWPTITAFFWIVLFLDEWNRHGIWAGVFWVVGVFLVSLLILGVIWLVFSIVKRVKGER